MTYINIVVEDDLSAAFARRLVCEASNDLCVAYRFPALSRTHASPGSGYIMSNIKRFNEAARHQPFLVLLDLDDRSCAPDLIGALLPSGINSKLLLRVAVREVESWLMADREAFARLLGISSSLVPNNTDCIHDPKKTLFSLVRRSRSRKLKEGILPKDTASIGPLYNHMLIAFLNDHWRSENAALNSRCLSKAIRSLMEFSV